MATRFDGIDLTLEEDDVTAGAVVPPADLSAAALARALWWH